MAITYPRALPTEMNIERCTMRTESVVGVAASPFTGEQQAYVFPGQWWDATVILGQVERTDAAVMTAWFASMNGKEKTFLFGDPAAATAQGSASSAPGTPLVNGASQTGAALICDGAPNGATNYLKAGDYVQLGSGSTARLHMVLEDVTSDGSGNFTLNLWPKLRSSPDNDAALVVATAQGVFRLKSNVTQWDETTVIYGFAMEIEEVL
jgi:hypothetical protein